MLPPRPRVCWFPDRECEQLSPEGLKFPAALCSKVKKNSEPTWAGKFARMDVGQTEESLIPHQILRILLNMQIIPP